MSLLNKSNNQTKNKVISTRLTNRIRVNKQRKKRELSPKQKIRESKVKNLRVNKNRGAKEIIKRKI